MLLKVQILGNFYFYYTNYSFKCTFALQKVFLVTNHSSLWIFYTFKRNVFSEGLAFLAGFAALAPVTVTEKTG